MRKICRERKKGRNRNKFICFRVLYLQWISPSLLPSSLTNRPSALCLFICPYVASHYLLIHSIIQPTTGYFCIVVSVLKSLKLNGRQQSVALQAFCWMGCFESNQKGRNPSATHQQVTLTLIIILFSTRGIWIYVFLRVRAIQNWPLGIKYTRPLRKLIIISDTNNKLTECKKTGLLKWHMHKFREEIDTQKCLLVVK